MGPMKLHFDIRDIFRAPRLALSGKKILIFTVGNLVGFIAYWIFSYIAFSLAGNSFNQVWSDYGLYPCLFGHEAPWYAWLVYSFGITKWIILILMSCTAVSRVTYKQLKGDEFYSSGDAYNFVKKHWHPVIFTSISLVLIIVFFLIGASVLALIGKIPYIGEFLFVIPYLLYFFGSIFTIYTIIVFINSLIYTPAIVASCEEDTMGAVFQNYSITWSQPWRIILYNLILLPIVCLGVHILKFFWTGGFKLINCVFGCSWFMGAKLSNIVGWSVNILSPSFCTSPLSLCKFSCCTQNASSICSFSIPGGAALSTTEIGAGIILTFFLFLIILSVISYGLSILSVGQTIMFVIFKKKTDDDNLLERKDEDELEENDEFDDDNFLNDEEENKEDESSDNDNGEDTSEQESNDEK